MHIFIFYGPWFPAKNKNALVFFDGVCGLCDRSVDFAITEDRERVLRFTPLQGITAKEYAERLSTVKTDSIILIDDTGIYDRSCAVLRICSQMGNIWRCTAIFYLVPKFIRNFIYDSVAKNRYNIFGKNEVCRFPTPEERGKILP